jgi:hypothetical protein
LTFPPKYATLPRMMKIIPFLLSMMLTAAPFSEALAAEPVELEANPTFASVSIQFATGSTEILSGSQTGLQNLQIALRPEEKSASLKALAERMVTERFGKGQFQSFANIVQHESSWNPQAVNRSSGACGLPQALPCSKIKDRSPEGQLQWMIDYIAARYGNPNNAWRFWQAHRWY